MDLLERYSKVTGKGVVDHLKQLAEPLKGMRVVHVNSTREGGGVAELLAKIVPMTNALGIETHWEVIEGTPSFFECTKGFHNAIQGNVVLLSDEAISEYERVNQENADRLRDLLKDADFVFIHDPQPAALLSNIQERKGRWIWRCHIDCSRPYRPVWKYLRKLVSAYDASVFSTAQFVQPLPHLQYIIAPSIDPLSEKNIELSAQEVEEVKKRFSLDPELPIVLQVSRYDRFKDPVGVIAAYRIARKIVPLQLVLVGGGATDDPEGEIVLKEVERAAGSDPDIHILVLPPDSHRTINALQRAADIVVQKSIREGFGLTVTEALWKSKPVIGGDTGGIRLQVIDHYTGFRVRSPEGAALRIRYLLHNVEKRIEMGQRGRRFVKENFLLTRHVREYLALMISLYHGLEERIDIATI